MSAQNLGHARLGRWPSVERGTEKVASRGHGTYLIFSNGSRIGPVTVLTVRRLSMICTLCGSVWWTPCIRSMVGLRQSESEQADDGLIRVDLSSDSSSMDVQQDGQEQQKAVSSKEIEAGRPANAHPRLCGVSSKTVVGSGPIRRAVAAGCEQGLKPTRGAVHDHLSTISDGSVAWNESSCCWLRASAILLQHARVSDEEPFSDDGPSWNEVLDFSFSLLRRTAVRTLELVRLASSSQLHLGKLLFVI